MQNRINGIVFSIKNTSDNPSAELNQRIFDSSNGFVIRANNPTCCLA